MSKRTILVTGAAHGIGLALSKGLAEEGHRVYLSDIDVEALDRRINELTSVQLDVVPLVLDVTDGSSICQVQEQASEQGEIDVLINNAGVQHVASLEEFPDGKWQHMINLMLVGPAMLTRALLPGMRENNFGRIINIGSIHSKVASPYKSAYSAAKHGLLGFSKAIALETASQNITINTICPSYVLTDLVRMQIADQAKQHGISEEEVISSIMLNPMPKANFIETDEILESVKYLMSDKARNITGTEISIDGGWTAR